MSGFTYEIIEDSPWEITQGKQVPMYIKVSGIKFTPIHNFRPESYFNGENKYIYQNNTTNNSPTTPVKQTTIKQPQLTNPFKKPKVSIGPVEQSISGNFLNS
jgi:hypothetical protein